MGQPAQIAILSGIYGTDPGFDVARPLNMTPFSIESGISKGYLRSAPGIVQRTATIGVDRGGIVWNGTHFRVLGSKLCAVGSSYAAILADVGAGGPVSLSYSFNLLAIAAGGRLYFWDGSNLSENNDPDLGVVNDMIWVDGYFMMTDGTSLIVTELTDPYAIDPIKYGSSEIDPDPVIALRWVRGEVAALNRNTIEFFQNIGGNGFPFVRMDGAVIPKGVVGKKAHSEFLQTFAFVGGGRNEEVSVWLAGPGQANKIADRDVEARLAALSDAQLADVVLEARQAAGSTELWLHLPTGSLVYHYELTQAVGLPVWTDRQSPGSDIYRLRNFVLHDGDWVGGDPLAPRLGTFDETLATQYGEAPPWKFETPLIYNDGAAAIVNSIELAGTFGRAPLGVDPRVFMSYTVDGLTWSQERSVSLGVTGQSSKRPAWHQGGVLRNWRGYRFRGLANTPFSIARLQADIEPLVW